MDALIKHCRRCHDTGDIRLRWECPYWEPGDCERDIERYQYGKWCATVARWGYGEW
jgi:hypothetical protein